MRVGRWLAGGTMIAAAVGTTVPTTTGCTTHQCDASSFSYYDGSWIDRYTYQTSDLDADWIPFPGQVTVNVVFPPGGASPGRAVVAIDGAVGTGTSPNGGADFQGGENWVGSGGYLAEYYLVSPTGFSVLNATCAKYWARFVVHFAPPGFTIFGGAETSVDGGTATLNDTWTWDGSAWSDQGPAPAADAGPEPGPSAREGAAMATVGGITYLMGGFDGVQTYLSDAWSWNGSVWSPSYLTAQAASRPWPSARAEAATAVVNGQLVLFGGHGVDVTNGSAVGDLQDLWTWDGKTTDSWVSVSPPTSGPSARSGAAAAALGDQMVLFGGSSNGTVLGDTWIWDGTSWTQQQPATSPPPRLRAAAATVPGGVLLFGGDSGDGPLGDTWVWDGTIWSQSAGIAPSARFQASVGVFDGDVVLFGGTDGNLELADTWTWSTEGWLLHDSISNSPTPRYGASGAGP